MKLSQEVKSRTPVFILAGGLGTRLAEETSVKPKPMVEIGEVPILLHIMRRYYLFGFNDFVICAGYRAWEIKQFFIHYPFRRNDIVIDNRYESHASPSVMSKNYEQERWRIRVVDTGLNCMTGARVARAFDVVSQQDFFEHFALTYGDGLSSVDLDGELQFHLSHGKIATVLGVHPIARFGELEADRTGVVNQFLEKPQSQKDLINGGFFFFSRAVRPFLSSDQGCELEKAPLTRLAEERQLMVYRHSGFWYPMDTLRDKNFLESVWNSGQAAWLEKGAHGVEGSPLN